MLKKTTGLILSICILCAMMVVSTTVFADVGDTVYANVAMGKAVSGSGNRLTGLTNGYIADTYWNLSSTTEEAVTVDLGQSYTIHHIVLVPTGSTASNSDMLTIQVSEDSGFTSPVTVGNTGDGITEATTYSDNLGGSYRYVRIIVDGSNQFNWSQLEEIEVYAPFTEAAFPADCNIAKDKPVYTNKADYLTNLTNLVDGNVTNYWDAFAPKTSYPACAYVDLLGSYDLYSIQISFIGDNITNQDKFDVMVSGDGKVWTTAHSVDAKGVPLDESLTVDMSGYNTTYRFVKIQQQSVGDYFKVSEIKVYATPATVGEYNDQGNLAFGKTVTSNGSNDNPLSSLVDGDLSTFTSNFINGTGYIQIDLGHSYDLDTVVFGFRLDGESGYQGQSRSLSMYFSELPVYSESDKVYTTPDSGVPFKDEISVHFAQTKMARFITIECPSSIRYFTIAEVIAYAKTNTQEPAFISLNYEDNAVTSVTLRTDAYCPTTGMLLIGRYDSTGETLLDCRVIKNITLKRTNQNQLISVANQSMEIEAGETVKAFLWSNDLIPIIK